jgi:hypothetical protein
MWTEQDIERLYGTPDLERFQSPNEIEENRLIEGKKVQDWPGQANAIITRQYHFLKEIYGSERWDALEKLGARSYAMKIKREAEKRGLI